MNFLNQENFIFNLRRIFLKFKLDLYYNRNILIDSKKYSLDHRNLIKKMASAIKNIVNSFTEKYFFKLR